MYRWKWRRLRTHGVNMNTRRSSCMVSEDAKDPEQEISLPTVIKSCFSVKVKKLKKLQSAAANYRMFYYVMHLEYVHTAVFMFLTGCIWNGWAVFPLYSPWVACVYLCFAWYLLFIKIWKSTALILLFCWIFFTAENVNRSAIITSVYILKKNVDVTDDSGHQCIWEDSPFLLIVKHKPQLQKASTL